MSAERDTATAAGIGGAIGWPSGGALAGAVSAVAFGAFMWFLDPEIFAVAIPAIYGLEPVGAAGWGIQVAHGIVLGVVFGFLVTRDPILGTVRTNVEAASVSRTSVWLRIVAAGFVFGLAIWAVLPLIVLPVWTEVIGTEAAGEFPRAPAESLVGHVLFGTVTGIVFATAVDLPDR